MSTARKGTTLRALRHRNFQLFFSGQLISLTGTWMQNVAQAWLVYRLTGSSALLGAVSFAGQIPIFLFSPLGGLAADRFPRRNVVIATQATSMMLACILAVLTLTNQIQIWQLFLLSALLGIVNAFDIPARQSFFIEMVGRDDLINAIALNSSMFNGARIVGPAIAGILVAQIGEGWCFTLNAVSYIAVIAGLLMMRLEPWNPTPHTISAWESIREGFVYTARTGPIRTLLLLLGMVSLAGLPYTVLMPIFADKILHEGAQGLGLLMGATGLGALVGALIIAARTDVKGFGRWVAVGCIVFSLALAAFAYSTNLYVSLALLLITGFAMMIQLGASNTLVQSMVPEHFRGRVMSVYSMLFMGMGPAGAILAGIAADRIGTPETIAIGAAISLLCGIVYALYLPKMRPEMRELIQARKAIT